MQKKNYNEFIEYLITNVINDIKTQVSNAENVSNELFFYKYQTFEKIHKYSIELLRKKKKLTLEELKELVEKKYKNESIEIDFYLINSDYIIYETTLKKDLNLDMSNFIGAKEYIQNSLNSEDIIISKNPSYDVLSKEYRVYSYAALDKKKKVVLEIGFFDKKLSEIKNKMYTLGFKDSIIKNMQLYSNYGKYIVNLTNSKAINAIDKQNFLIKNINSEDKTLSIVKKVSKEKKSYSFEKTQNNRVYIVNYTYILDLKISNTKVKNYILKTELDITELKNKLTDLEMLFYFTLIASVSFICLFFVFLNSSLIKPFKDILSHMQSWKKIDSPNILNKNDELSELAIVFNKAYTKQMELNNRLQNKVELASEENRKKLDLLQKQSKFVQMGEILSMIAHQWRQPLGSIGSITLSLQMQLLSGRVDFDDKKSKEEYLRYVKEKYETITEHVQFLSTTIDDFRSFFKPDNEKELVNILLPIKKALNIVEISLEKNGIKVLQKLEKDCTLYLYKNEMIQVFLNILKNAEDSLLEKKVDKPLILVEVKQRDTYIQINVSDNAGGVPSSILENIFDPYFSTKNEKNGTGLGLYMSKIIVEEHHKGKLSVKNTSEGACFTINLKSINFQ